MPRMTKAYVQQQLANAFENGLRQGREEGRKAATNYVGSETARARQQALHALCEFTKSASEIAMALSYAIRSEAGQL